MSTQFIKFKNSVQLFFEQQKFLYYDQVWYYTQKVQIAISFNRISNFLNVKN